MENETGYDLNGAIEQWRNDLSTREGLSADNLRELESHLREVITDFRARGLAEAESFLLACRRLGNASAVAAEFQKADLATVWRTRVFWMVTGVAAMSLINDIPGLYEFALASLRELLQKMAGPWGSWPSSLMVWIMMIGQAVWMFLIFFSVRGLLRGSGQSLFQKLEATSRSRIARIAIGILFATHTLSAVGRWLVLSIYSPAGRPQPTMESIFSLVMALAYAGSLGGLLARFAPRRSHFN